MKEPPAFRLANAANVFVDRAARFDALAAAAKGEPAFMRLMARVAAAQHSALQAHPEPDAPSAQHLARCRAHGLPPLGADAPPGAAWRGALHHIAQAIHADASPATQRALNVIKEMTEDALDTQAGRLLSLDYPALEPALAPFIGAALQVHWVKRATALGEGECRKLDVPTVCPVCGSLPIASVLRVDVPVPGTRYLHCVLCATDWRMGRGFCSQCEAQEKLAYYHIENENDGDKNNAAVRAEACEECKGYIKSLNQEKDPQADPVADDLATLPLDILLDESGYQRASPNYFLVPGQG